MISKRLILIMFLSFLANCASSSAYLQDRKNDLLDIIDVGVGVGGGANVEIGKFSIGAGAGLGNLAMQGGEFGSRGKTWEGILLPYQKYVIFNSNREAQERIMFRRKIYIVNSMMMVAFH